MISPGEKPCYEYGAKSLGESGEKAKSRKKYVGIHHGLTRDPALTNLLVINPLGQYEVFGSLCMGPFSIISDFQIWNFSSEQNGHQVSYGPKHPKREFRTPVWSFQ